MRKVLPFLFVLFAAPSLAQAGLDFKCSSVNYGDQVSGWLRFGFNGRNGNIELEYWNAYPPIGLVNADLDNGSAKDGLTHYISEADRHNGTVAKLQVPANALGSDKFRLHVETSYQSPEDNKKVIKKYLLNCVRH